MRAIVAQVSVAADKGDTLPILTGVRVEIEGDTMTLLATDRYRLAVRDLPGTSVLRENRTPETWGAGRWLGERSRGGVNRLSALLTLPLGVLRRLRKNVWQGARSCNLAIWRSDLDRVDGFDADYRGWGKEDSDIIARLLHAGVRRKDGIFATGVIHLWHPEAERSQLARNEDKLAGVLAGNRVRALRGLSSLQGTSTTSVRAN